MFGSLSAIESTDIFVKGISVRDLNSSLTTLRDACASNVEIVSSNLASITESITSNSQFTFMVNASLNAQFLATQWRLTNLSNTFQTDISYLSDDVFRLLNIINTSFQADISDLTVVGLYQIFPYKCDVVFSVCASGLIALNQH